jgi:flagellar biosynthesis protein FlhF
VITRVFGEAESQSEKADNQVLKEVQELRSLMRSVLSNSPKSILPQPVLQVRKELMENDLEEEIVEELIERGIRQFQQLDSITEQEFRVILTNFIKEELDKEFEPLPLAPTTRVASFIGPTGVGKTTTIAKIAAEQVLTRGKKVGLITTDTYRIAAVEQLRTYANILNVPLEVCYSQEDANRAMTKFADCDLILVDTAGRNYNNEVNVKELNSYLQVLKPDETYLVLSLTTKASDLMQIVSNFDQVNIDKFLFTKADETRSYGAIYNLINRYKIPLSYLTTGQNVPDDIEIVSTGRLASLIVGEKSYV